MRARAIPGPFVALSITLAAILAGCGGSSSSNTAEAQARPLDAELAALARRVDALEDEARAFAHQAELDFLRQEGVSRREGLALRIDALEGRLDALRAAHDAIEALHAPRPIRLLASLVERRSTPTGPEDRLLLATIDPEAGLVESLVDLGPLPAAAFDAAPATLPLASIPHRGLAFALAPSGAVGGEVRVTDHQGDGSGTFPVVGFPAGDLRVLHLVAVELPLPSTDGSAQEAAQKALRSHGAGRGSIGPLHLPASKREP